jgi:Importin beta binding domain
MTQRLNLFKRGYSEARELRKQKRDEFLAKKKNEKGGLPATAAAQVPVEEVKELVPEPIKAEINPPIVESVTDDDEASPNNSAVEEDEERDGVDLVATEEAEHVKDESRTTIDESPVVSSTGLLCGCL